MILETIKRLTFGLALIGVATAILLYTDVNSRKTSRPRSRTATATNNVFRVALVQHASIPALEDGTAGIIEALAKRGFQDGGRLQLSRYNAEADIGTANAIAKEVTSGGSDLIVTMSTISLQTVANANKFGAKTRHVFGLVSDPYGAGVGIDAANHASHPPYLTGYGSMAPVAEIFRTAREMCPELKSVGLAWNPAEANSRAQTEIARKVCKELAIELVEANAENSTAAIEAVNSLIARGVEAIWISGDITISLASYQILNAARRARIPVFTALPPKVEQGALFDLGADYREVGRLVGHLAVDILDGKKNPAEVPVENLLPEVFLLNETVPATLKDKWIITEAVRQRATGVISALSPKLTPLNATAKTKSDRQAKELRLKSPASVITAAASTSSAAIRRPLERKAKVYLIEHLETPNVEINRAGILAGFEHAGLKRGQDFELRIQNAQGDMATLSTMIDAAANEGTDLLLTASTPALQAALRRARGRPIVFSLVANPIVAGAGSSETAHLPFITGAYITAPHDLGIAALKQCLPNAKRVGTLFVPAEVNSVYYKDELVKAAARRGIEVEAIGVSTSSEVADAALALCERNVDAICQISDNLTAASFASIAQAAQRARLPLMGFASDQTNAGAFMTVSRDYYDGGVAAAQIAARVLRGEAPARIPFHLVEKLRYSFNLAAAARSGIAIPPDLLRLGDVVD